MKKLTLKQIKAAVYGYFNVTNTKELKASGRYALATNDLGKLDLRKRSIWEMFYREYVNILPEERNQQGKDCINGVHIYNYFRPWDVFGLDPKVATNADIKKAYYGLAKVYHPDNQETGNAKTFDRIHVMYESITLKVA
jgi:hypothetical protein